MKMDKQSMLQHIKDFSMEKSLTLKDPLFREKPYNPKEVFQENAENPLPLNHQQIIETIELGNIPSADMYERSYMHKEIVDNVIVAGGTGVIITTSIDGFLKFWNKTYHGIEFVKQFHISNSKINCFSLSYNNSKLAIISNEDKAMKLFEVISYDMINIYKLNFDSELCEFINKEESVFSIIAIVESKSKDIQIIKLSEKLIVIKVLKLHNFFLKCLKFNFNFNTVISVDSGGLIEYWDNQTFEFNNKKVHFNLKSETDLYKLAESKTYGLSLNYSFDGGKFAIYGKDRKIRIFDFLSGKLIHTFNESLENLKNNDPNSIIYISDKIEFDKKYAIEKEIEKNIENISCPNGIFNESGNYIFIPSYVGIKVYNLQTQSIVRILGKPENSERFLSISFYKGEFKKNPNAVGKEIHLKETDPTIFATAYKKSRFYLFTRREPEENTGKNEIGRDIFNEKPTKEQIEIAQKISQKTLPTEAVIYTSMGEIYIKLFPIEAPKAVENFIVHSKNGYYDGHIFHRVIKAFMVQTGDPNGDGTGGQSIWGTDFDDEFSDNLKHDRPFTLSMANSGPNSNGSQWFITTVPCTWLDRKHTVFGRCTKGMDVVKTIEEVKTDEENKPFVDIRIHTIKIIDLPET